MATETLKQEQETKPSSLPSRDALRHVVRFGPNLDRLLGIRPQDLLGTKPKKSKEH